MSKYFPRQLLFRLRNEIPLERVIAEHLNWPGKRRDGRFSFVCPRCGESQTAVNPQHQSGPLLPLRGELQRHRLRDAGHRTRLRRGSPLPGRPAACPVLSDSCRPDRLIYRLLTPSPSADTDIRSPPLHLT